MTTPLPDSVLAALQAGERIQAIKLLRTARGIGLKEAKAIVDAATPRPARQPRSGLAPGMLVSLAAGVGALLWVLISRR